MRCLPSISPSKYNHHEPCACFYHHTPSMEAAGPSSRFLEQPTEGTPLLFGDSDRASLRARALDPDDEPWRTDANDDAAAAPGATTRLPHSREFLVGLLFSLVTASLTLVFSFAIMIMGILSPSDFHIQWGMRESLQAIAVLVRAEHSQAATPERNPLIIGALTGNRRL